MNSFSAFLKRFIKFAFSYNLSSSENRSSSQRSVDTASVEIRKTRNIQPRNHNSDVQASDKQVKLRLIIQINWLLMGVCTLSFLSMLAFAFIYPDKEIPDLVQNAFFTTLGWFGGILATFFKVEQSGQ